ncbi:MAG: hypothetical protein H6920_02540 [Sphingomonadaceae bacterium]|jgi:hypothetical protein|nr:hypothetical protein [Sphingomonadaceae bacterium]MCP5384916.1 hypothetical protein [Altererythrobacter sp.]MCP5390489.1 hypothetical protein [Sphingomonadaceae bacterium]MCP5392683.1 hypothetical protein [Sphingomonadaceae bacterium]
MEMIKAVPIGGLLTAIVSLVIGSTGSRGGHLAIHHMAVGTHEVLWSWPLFLTATGLAWALMLMQR